KLNVERDDHLAHSAASDDVAELIAGHVLELDGPRFVRRRLGHLIGGERRIVPGIRLHAPIVRRPLGWVCQRLAVGNSWGRCHAWIYSCRCGANRRRFRYTATNAAAMMKARLPRTSATSSPK